MIVEPLPHQSMRWKYDQRMAPKTFRPSRRQVHVQQVVVAGLSSVSRVESTEIADSSVTDTAVRNSRTAARSLSERAAYAAAGSTDWLKRPTSPVAAPSSAAPTGVGHAANSRSNALATAAAERARRTRALTRLPASTFHLCYQLNLGVIRDSRGAAEDSFPMHLFVDRSEATDGADHGRAMTARATDE